LHGSSLLHTGACEACRAGLATYHVCLGHLVWQKKLLWASGRGRAQVALRCCCSHSWWAVTVAWYQHCIA
jgi:hypothetical protein